LQLFRLKATTADHTPTEAKNAWFYVFNVWFALFPSPENAWAACSREADLLLIYGHKLD